MVKRSGDRKGYRSGHYNRSFQTTAGDVILKVPKLKGVLKRSWGGEIQNVSIFVAIGVNQDGCREIIGAAEGMKEDKESWRSFFVWLKERGLTGVRLIIGDKCLGMLETDSIM